MRYLFFLICVFTLMTCSSKNTTNSIKEVIYDDPFTIIDISCLETEKESYSLYVSSVEYIPLETNNNCLIDNYAIISFISSSYIMITNLNEGTIAIFDRKSGLIISRFNAKGRSGKEYLRMGFVTLDEKNKEIFVTDYYALSRCQVYTIEGEYIRTLQFEEGVKSTEIYNFDNESIFVYNSIHFSAKDTTSYCRPFLLVSKQDGHTILELNISVSTKLKSSRLLQNGNVQSIVLPEQKILRDSIGFLLAPISSDTIYRLTYDRNVTPILVRTPSVFDKQPEDRLVLIEKTNRYFFFVKYCFDFEKMRIIDQADLFYDLTNKKFFNANEQIVDQTEQISHQTNIIVGSRGDYLEWNIRVHLIYADRLKNDLCKGKLHGLLKKIAEKINEDDNPIIAITKFQ